MAQLCRWAWSEPSGISQQLLRNTGENNQNVGGYGSYGDTSLATYLRMYSCWSDESCSDAAEWCLQRTLRIRVRLSLSFLVMELPPEAAHCGLCLLATS